MEYYEDLIIGSGHAGKFLSWALAGAGRRTALVERRWVGGSCNRVACMPTKSLIHSAKVASYLHRAEEFGFKAVPVVTDMAGILRRKRDLLAGLLELNLGAFAQSGAELVMGEARFTGTRQVEVRLNDGGTRRISAERVFLSLGTRSIVPDTPGLAAAAPMTHVEALDLTELPDHLAVLGGGYVGLEFAQAIRRLGAEVTIIEQSDQLAKHEDPDVSAALLDLFQDEGITVLLKTRVRQVQGRSGEAVQISVEGPEGVRELEATHLLVATGRRPNTEGIGLAETGVELDRKGFIKVNERLETTAVDVWAVGDCAGTPQFTHAAHDDYRILRDNLLRGANRTVTGRLIPFCLFTDPELVRVGPTETELQREGRAYRIFRMPMSAVVRTRAISATRGFIKVLVAAESDDILGFTAFGAETMELLAAAQAAMTGRLPYTTLRDGIFPHPTAAEGFMYLFDGASELIQPKELLTEGAAT